MAERGKHKYAYVSAASNQVISTQSGSLYSITGTFPAGSLVRVDDTHSFAQGILNINARSSNTVGAFSASTTFDGGLGINTGIVVAASSNASVTVEYE